MADLELVFNEESGVWEERPEPYIRVEIETEEDFEHLKAAVEFYKNRDKYEEVVRCKDCKHWIHLGDGNGDCTNRRFHIPGLADICMSAEDFCCLGERKNDGR